jgi:hypothetical protein
MQLVRSTYPCVFALPDLPLCVFTNEGRLWEQISFAQMTMGNKAAHEHQFANAAGMIPPSMSLPCAALDPKAAARAEAAAAARVTQKRLEAAAEALAAHKKRNTPLCRIWRAYSQAMLVAEYCFSALVRGDTKNKAALINLVRIAQSVDPFSAEAIATQDPWRIPAHMLEQVCPVCGNYSNCTHSELEFLWSKDIPQPKQCKQCRKRRGGGASLEHPPANNFVIGTSVINTHPCICPWLLIFAVPY